LAVNLILSSVSAPGLVTSVADGGAVPVEPGTEVRLSLGGEADTALRIADLTEMELGLSGEDVVVRTPDGQAITLLGYAESLAEQALVLGMTGRQIEGDADDDTPAAGPDGLSAGMVVEGWDQPLLPETGTLLGQKVMIDYLGQGDGPDLSRVELYFDRAGDVSVEALFAALEVELGLKDRPQDGTPRIASVAVLDEPLVLADLVGDAPGGSHAATAGFGALPALAEALGFLGGEEEALAVNDNSFIINA